jgi:hypothetical protein
VSNFYGKYRGTVKGNNDLTRLGQLEVTCPAVLGDSTAWAMPCVPFAGLQEGFFMLPQVGSNVWVEFEGGNPARAIWSGCFWGVGQMPLNASTPMVHTIKTKVCEITISDTAGVTLAMGPTCSIKLAATGIEITYGANKLKLDPAMISLNGSNLQVLP